MQHFEGRQFLCEEVSELGVAILRTDAGRPYFTLQIRTFYEQNCVQAATIRMHARRYEPVVGTLVAVRNQDAVTRLHTRLSEIQGERILLN
jgi:hypothetical protein